MHTIAHGLKLEFKMAPGKLHLVLQAKRVRFLFARHSFLCNFFDVSYNRFPYSLNCQPLSTRFAFTTAISCISRLPPRNYIISAAAGPRLLWLPLRGLLCE